MAETTNALSNIQDIGIQSTKPKAYVFDIEVFPNLFCASFLNISTDEKKSFLIFSDPRGIHEVNQLPDLLRFLKYNITVLIGYNNFSYDDVVMNHLITAYDFFKNEKPREITASCKMINDKLIKKEVRRDKQIDVLRQTKNYESRDLIELFNTINRVSLKQLAINLKWHRIMDLPFDPDYVVMKEDVEKIIDYNFNDCYITREVFFNKRPEMQERFEFSKMIGVNSIVNSSDTNCAKIILRKFYSEATGLKYDQFKDKRTYYKRIPLRSCIAPKIQFQTEAYQQVYDYVAKTVINPNIKNESSKKKKQFEYIHSSKYLTHTLGLGGIHSNNPSQILEEDAEFEYIDLDVQSYYPRIMINEKLYPTHLGPAFTHVYEHNIFWPRIRYKEEGNDIAAQFLKITANATFGLTKSQYSWLYDPWVSTTICISGQLYMLMLMERLELFTDCIVVYSNTDGMTVRVPRVQKQEFYNICKQWVEYTGYILEFANFKKMILKDVNNFLIVTYDPKKPIKMKGDFQIKPPITSGYTFPVVAKALYEYYINGKNPEYYIKHERDPYEFMRAVRTSMDKYSLSFFSLSDPDNPVSQAKSNRWIVTRGNPAEGKLRKFSYQRQSYEELQKGQMVTLTNDIDPKNFNINDVKVDYNFYIREAYKIIREIKKLKRKDHHPTAKQLSII